MNELVNSNQLKTQNLKHHESNDSNMRIDFRTIGVSKSIYNKLSISNEKKYPFYGQSTNNRGIIEYLHLNDEVLNCFSIGKTYFFTKKK